LCPFVSYGLDNMTFYIWALLLIHLTKGQYLKISAPLPHYTKKTRNVYIKYELIVSISSNFKYHILYLLCLITNQLIIHVQILLSLSDYTIISKFDFFFFLCSIKFSYNSDQVIIVTKNCMFEGCWIPGINNTNSFMQFLIRAVNMRLNGYDWQYLWVIKLSY
jgi:hypothetical protein